MEVLSIGSFFAAQKLLTAEDAEVAKKNNAKQY
jgi:hypothetical protein